MSKQTRKRSLLNENIEEERNATSPKKAKESVTFISDVEFKFLLRDEETVVEGLEKFIQTAEAFIDGVPCPDIVSSFCISSPNLAEFWNLIEPSSCKLKINDVALVFECLEQILARIRNDLVKLSSVGEAIVQKVLAVHMGQLYYSLRDQNNSRTIKSGLKLLIAMVLLSDKSKKAILSRLNFGHQNFHPLFNRRNRKDPQDVRSCVVLLTLAFLLDSDNTVINFLVQQKTFLQSVIGGLMYDPKEVVIDTLATLMDKVVKCPGVSKTDKVKLFSEVSLKKICELLSWKGPGGWRAGKKKSDQDEEVDVPDDDRQVVADVAHNFLTELCCSHKHGINFHDKTLGIGNRNQNQLLTHFLEWLVKTIDDAQTSDLIISILCTCPDQIKIVLNNLCAFLSPRWSEKWIKLMDWLAKLYISLPEDLQFLAEKDTANEANKIVSMAVVLCLPPPKVCVTLQQGIKHEDPRVRHTALKVISVLLFKAINVKKKLMLRLSGEQKNSLAEIVSDSYTASVLMMLPPLSQIFFCADKIMQKVENEESSDFQEKAAVILQVLTLYQHLSPSLISDKQKDLSNLIEMVGQVVVTDTSKTECDEDKTAIDNVNSRVEQPLLPQLYLLGLLSEIDAKTLYLGRESILLKLLSFASHCGQYRSLCVGLIGKMLQSVEVFSGHGKELSVWVETALKNTFNADLEMAVSGSSIIRFMANCLGVLINNPAPYVDRLLEAATESSLSDDQTLESKINEKNTLEDILAMDQKELDDKLTVFQPSSFHIQKNELPLSPLIFVALDNLNSNTGVDDCVKSYVNNVLAQLVYTVTSPQTLASIVCSHKVAIDEPVREYIRYWHCNEFQVKPTKIKPLPAELYGRCTNLLMRVFFSHSKTATDVSDAFGQLTKEIRSLDTFAKLKTLRLVLFFMSQTAERHSKEQFCHQVLEVLQEVAEVLIDEVADDENWISRDKQTELTDEQLSKSEMKEKKEHSASSVFSQVAEPLQNTFSDVLVSLNQSVDTSKEDFLHLLRNPTFKKFVFQKKGKSNKANEKFDILACSLSRFMNKVLNKCKTWTWFLCEKEIIQQLVSDLVTSLIVPAKPKHSELDSIHLDMLINVYPILDLVTLSKSVTQLLTLPLSSFFNKDKDESTDTNETHTFKVLCLMLQHWVHLIKADPSFICASLFQQLTSDVQIKKVPIQMEESNKNHSNAIRISYSVEESTLQSPAAFASMFELLPLCRDSNFHDVVLFVVSHLPEVAHHFRTAIFNELLQMQLNVKNKKTVKEQIVACLIENVSECFQKFCTWIQANASLVFKQKKWNLINSYLTAANKFLCESDQAIVTIRKAAVHFLKSASFNTSSKELLQVYRQLSVNMQYKEVQFQRLLTRAIQESIKSHDTSDKQSLFEVLVVSTKFSHQSEEEESRKASSDLAELALRHLLYLTSSKTTRHSEMENYILDLLPQLIVVKDIKSVSFLSSFWDKLVSNTLRCLFMNSKLLKLLCQLVPIVYSASSSSSAQTMFHMCINHTAFMNVMMAPEHAKAKSELVHLLYLLGELEPSVYAPGLSKALIGSYNATLSETDQRLLLMIKKCQKDSDKKFECPCVWGKAAAEYHTVSKVLGPSLDKEASVKSIIEQLNQQQMMESMLHFPLRRTQKCTSIMEASEFKSESSCYDPNFLLPLFVQILSPDKIVPLQLFVERGCLSYLLVALSSHDIESRLLAYHALNDFYQHAEGSRWQERKEINFLLDLLNSSRDKTGQKLPYVIALFFARVVKLLMHPADPLYVPIFKFLLAKPEIDLHNVPEFYQLFFSSTLQYKQERCWLLSLLSDGVRETSDYWIYQRKLIFKIIFSFYDSTLCDDKSQVLILKTMKNALKEKFIAVDLVKKHGLMAWLLGVSKSLSSCPQHTDVVCELVYTLWSSLNSMRYKSPAPTKKQQTQKSVNMDEEDESETGVMSDEPTEDNNENKTNKEGEVETSCRNHNSERDIGQKCLSASVPTSTRVEIGLVVKCLIWNLNNASYESLLKLLDVILSLLTTETGPPQEHTDNTVRDLTRANVCTSVNLTCLETYLLLYHVANAAQLENTAKSARDLLHKKGVTLGVTLDTSVKKVNKRPQNKPAKVSSSKLQLQDVDDLENEHDEDMTGNVIKLDSEAELCTSFTIEEKQKLVHLFYRIARLTNTLIFI